MMPLAFKYLLFALCSIAILSNATQSSSDEENQNDGEKEKQKNLITNYFSKQANKNPTTRAPISFTQEQFDALINSLTTRQASNPEPSAKTYPDESNTSSDILNKGKRPISSILDNHAKKKQDELASATSSDTRGQADQVFLTQEQFNSLITSLKGEADKKAEESLVEQQNLAKYKERVDLSTSLTEAKRPTSSILDTHSKEKTKSVDTVKFDSQKQQQTTPSTSKSPSSKGKGKATSTSNVKAKDTPSISYPKGKRPRYNEPTSKAEKSTIIKGLLDRLKEIQKDDLDKMVADKIRKQENEYRTYKNKLMFDDYKKHANNLEAYLRKAGNKKTFIDPNTSRVKSKTQTVDKKTKPKPTSKPETLLNPEPLASFDPFQSPNLFGSQFMRPNSIIDARSLPSFPTTPIPSSQFRAPTSTTPIPSSQFRAPTSTTPIPSSQFRAPTSTTQKPRPSFSDAYNAYFKTTLPPHRFDSGYSPYNQKPSSSSHPMNENDGICGLCSERLDGLFGDPTVITKYCKHSFHHQCLKASVLSQGSIKRCPKCNLVLRSPDLDKIGVSLY